MVKHGMVNISSSILLFAAYLITSLMLHCCDFVFGGQLNTYTSIFHKFIQDLSKHAFIA